MRTVNKISRQNLLAKIIKARRIGRIRHKQETVLPFKLVAIIDVNMAVIRIKKPRGPGEKDQPLEGEPKLKENSHKDKGN